MPTFISTPSLLPRPYRHCLWPPSCCPLPFRSYVHPMPPISFTFNEPTPTTQSIPIPVPTPCPSRLFSNLSISPTGKLQHNQPSELSNIALIAGTMIGAGVLALPTVSAPAGFIPSSTALLVVWAYMLATGLLISEVSIHAACISLGRPTGISMLSLSSLSLGRVGAGVCAAAYIFQQYATMVAYTAQGGVILSGLLCKLGNLLFQETYFLVSPVVGVMLFVGVLGGGMYLFSEQVVEKVNNALVGGVFVSFLMMVRLAFEHVEMGRLFGEMDWGEVFNGGLIPVLLVSCVYHNVVSTVAIRLEGDRVKIRRVIAIGSAVPLGMFLLYNGMILGSGGVGGQDVVEVAVFSLLAIATSFVGFVEAITDMWVDFQFTALGESAEKVRDTRYKVFLATLVPPVVFSLIWPNIFVSALEAAGIYGDTILFGVLPGLMAWKFRKNGGEEWTILDGGDAVLLGVGGLAAVLLGSRVFEVLSTVSWNF